MEIIEDKGKKYLQYVENGQFKKKKLSKEALELITDSRGRLKPRQYIESLVKNDFKPQIYSRYRKLKVVRSNTVRDDIRKNKVEELKIRRQKLMEKKERTPQEEREIKIIDAAIQQYISGNTEIIDSVIQNLHTNLANINVSDEALKDIAKKASFRLFSEETENKLSKDFVKQMDEIKKRYNDDLKSVESALEELNESAENLKESSDIEKMNEATAQAVKLREEITQSLNSDELKESEEKFEEYKSEILAKMESKRFYDMISNTQKNKGREAALEKLQKTFRENMVIMMTINMKTSKNFKSIDEMNKEFNNINDPIYFIPISAPMNIMKSMTLTLRQITGLNKLIFVHIIDQNKTYFCNVQEKESLNYFFTEKNGDMSYILNKGDEPIPIQMTKKQILDTKKGKTTYKNILVRQYPQEIKIGDVVGFNVVENVIYSLFFDDKKVDLKKYIHDINMNAIANNVNLGYVSSYDSSQHIITNIPTDQGSFVVYFKNMGKFDTEAIMDKVALPGEGELDDVLPESKPVEDKTDELINIEPVTEDAKPMTAQEMSDAINEGEKKESKGLKSSCGSVLKDLMDDMKKYNVGFKMYISENKYYKKRVEPKK